MGKEWPGKASFTIFPFEPCKSITYSKLLVSMHSSQSEQMNECTRGRNSFKICNWVQHGGKELLGPAPEKIQPKRIPFLPFWSTSL